MSEYLNNWMKMRDDASAHARAELGSFYQIAKDRMGSASAVTEAVLAQEGELKQEGILFKDPAGRFITGRLKLDKLKFTPEEIAQIKEQQFANKRDTAMICAQRTFGDDLLEKVIERHGGEEAFALAVVNQLQALQDKGEPLRIMDGDYKGEFRTDTLDMIALRATPEEAMERRALLNHIPSQSVGSTNRQGGIQEEYKGVQV